MFTKIKNNYKQSFLTIITSVKTCSLLPSSYKRTLVRTTTFISKDDEVYTIYTGPTKDLDAIISDIIKQKLNVTSECPSTHTVIRVTSRFEDIDKAVKQLTNKNDEEDQ